MRTSSKVAVLLAFPCVALATTIIPHTLRQRADESDRVALVQVIDQHVEKTDNPVMPLKTFTRVLIGQNLRGAGPEEVTLVQIGGRLGELQIEIPGDAHFEIGETAVIFMRCRASPDRCHLVELGEGKLHVSGNEAMVKDLFTQKWSRRTIESLAKELAGTAR